jgi:hypothetical protein
MPYQVGLPSYCQFTSLAVLQIFCIGMLGEYLGKIYAEVKARPRYLIEKTTSGIARATHFVDTDSGLISTSGVADDVNPSNFL